MKNLKTVLLVMALLAIFCACEKDEDVQQSTSKTDDLFKGVSRDILYFENYEEFNEELDFVMNLDETELKVWEDQKGFKSIASFCEDKAFSIDIDEFETDEQFIEFLKENEPYLKSEIDENGEENIEPKFFDYRARYFLNFDKMYQIGNRVYKEFENGTLSCFVSNESVLKDIENPENYINVEGFIYNKIIETELKVESCGASLYHGGSGNRRKIRMTLKSYDVYQYSTSWKWQFITEPRKKRAGRWYSSSQTMTVDLKCVVSFKKNGHLTNRKIEYVGHKKTRKWVKDVHSETIDWGFPTQDYYLPQFIAVDFMADDPGCSPQLIKCNDNLISYY